MLAFPGVSRVFPADAALGLSARIIGEKNTAVNRIFGQDRRAKRDILTNAAPETIHISRAWVGPSRLCCDRKACVAQPPPAVLVEERPFMAAKRITFYRALALVPSAFFE
jgi:hypothetical protein